MRKPYYRVTAVCGYLNCQGGKFTVERKTVQKTGESGQAYRIYSVVCPRCHTWARITKIEEVA